MSASKRTDVLGTLHKVLAKHYKPYKTADRPLLEQLLYANCLEDSKPDLADECFARLQESFFDWNEVRVTTVRELSELLRGLHDPERAATAIKQVLHAVFEAIYVFDLEPLKKQNLGIAEKTLQQYRGTTPFSVSFVVQHALGGHSIPVSRAAYEIFLILGVIGEKEAKEGTVPGLERAIPKNKGIEFASILQQFAADYAASPTGQGARAILLEVDPDAKTRFPKRPAKKGEEGETRSEGAAATVPPKPSKADRDKGSPDKSSAEKGGGEKNASEKPRVDKSSTDKAAGAKAVKPQDGRDGDKGKKEADRKPADNKKAGDKKPTGKKADDRPATDKKDLTAKKPPAAQSPAKDKPAPPDKDDKKKAGKKPTKPIAKKASPGAKKSTSKQLARRKPR